MCRAIKSSDNLSVTSLIVKKIILLSTSKGD
jgi:hypothetical protein